LKYLLESESYPKHKLFHLGGAERVSRYELALKIAERFQLDKNLISAVSRLSVQMPAPRPEDVSLDSSFALEILGFDPPSLNEQLTTLKFNTST
jgi:dTDP-4-dehydrorhamnose reductase